MTQRRLSVAFVALVLLVSGAAGCGGGDSSSPTAQTPTASPAPAATLRPAEIIQGALPATVLIEIKTASGADYSGSGFVIDPAGIIVTNLHVIRGAVSAKVSLPNGDTYDRITVRVVDEVRDIAIIKVPGFNLPTVALADSDTVSQGDAVVLLGNPLGLGGSATTGIVSAIRAFGGSQMFQTDAAANPGNSGGPMLNEQGVAVGILTSRFTQAENLNFAVPVNYARGLLDINDGMSLATLAAKYPETAPDSLPASTASAAAPAAPAAELGPDGITVRAGPVRGDAQLGYTEPVVKYATIDGRVFVVTTIEVKNLSSGAIAGLTVDDFWYDRDAIPVTGASFSHPRPLQPEEVITVTLEVPRHAQMDRNQYQFKHANGDIVATLQPEL